MNCSIKSRLDGTIQYTSAVTGYGPPFVSDVLGSSPTVDTYGRRSTLSMFVEMLMPLAENINAQAAIRHDELQLAHLYFQQEASTFQQT